MKTERGIHTFLQSCRSKQLQQRTIKTYEQGLLLFAAWLKESEDVEEIEQIREMTVRDYKLHLQERGKYTVSVDAGKERFTIQRTERITWNRSAARRSIIICAAYARGLIGWWSVKCWRNPQ